MLLKEKVLTKADIKKELDKMNHKKVIKVTSIGIVGLGTFKLVLKHSATIDNFFIHGIKDFLLSSNYLFLNVPVPNWAFIIIVFGFIFGLFVDIYSFIKKGGK